MTQLKTTNLRQSICNEFSEIFRLCKEVLEKATKPSLIKATLDTLLRFLSWIPLGYIFETDLLQLLERVSLHLFIQVTQFTNSIMKQFFESQQYRNVTLKCLTEIGSLSVDSEYGDKIVSLFTIVMASVNKMIPPSTDICAVYENSSDDDQEFVQNLAIFLTSFLSSHNKVCSLIPYLFTQMLTTGLLSDY